MFVKSIMKISRDDYSKLLQYSKNNLYSEISDFVENIANDSPFKPCGYGFSDPGFFEEDGKYFVSWKRWSSCD